MQNHLVNQWFFGRYLLIVHSVLPSKMRTVNKFCFADSTQNLSQYEIRYMSK